MKRIGWVILTLALLGLLILARYVQPEQVASQSQGVAFDALARWVPGDAEQVFFLDLKPNGEAGRHWERIRRHLETNPTGQEALDALRHQFRVEEYGLDESIVGPVVNSYWDGAEYVIAQVSDEEAAENGLRQHFEDVVWEQEEYEGKTLYHGRTPQASARDRLAWTIHDGLLFLSIRYEQEASTGLQELLSLAQADSLAALPAWQTLRHQLPDAPMGLLFFNIAAQARRNPPASDDISLGTALGQQLEAMAFAAVPEKKGVRVEIGGTVTLQADAPPEIHALFNLPAVDPTTWTGLPSDTAIALTGHDASILWMWMQEIFDIDLPDQIRDAVGLDLAADLAGAEGPLTGDFALAITPPLPDQPVSEGLPAGQLLILDRGVPEAQMAGVQAAMESRGAVFGSKEVEGIALQTQTGTELTGYAISYGFDGDTLLFGSSPEVIGQAVTTQREGGGLVTLQNFWALLAASPAAPSLVIYLNSEPLTSLAQTNMTEEEYQNREDYVLLEAFDAVGINLRFAPDKVDGVIYFFVPD